MFDSYENTPEGAKQALQSVIRYPYAHGGYPRYAITSDGGCLCHACCGDNYRLIRESQRDVPQDGWQVVGIDVNWEDTCLYCDNCNALIPSAYGEDDTEGLEL